MYGRDHVTNFTRRWAEEEGNCTRDQSVLATICRNLGKGGIPCALQLAANT